MLRQLFIYLALFLARRMISAYGWYHTICHHHHHHIYLFRKVYIQQSQVGIGYFERDSKMETRRTLPKLKTHGKNDSKLNQLRPIPIVVWYSTPFLLFLPFYIPISQPFCRYKAPVSFLLPSTLFPPSRPFHPSNPFPYPSVQLGAWGAHSADLGGGGSRPPNGLWCI